MLRWHDTRPRDSSTALRADARVLEEQLRLVLDANASQTVDTGSPWLLRQHCRVERLASAIDVAPPSSAAVQLCRWAITTSPRSPSVRGDLLDESSPSE